MRLFHATSRKAARSIDARGFTESEIFPGVSGVFLSDRPLTAADGVSRSVEVVFCIEVPDTFPLKQWEVVEDGRPEEAYREWLVPAKEVNAFPRRRLSSF